MKIRETSIILRIENHVKNIKELSKSDISEYLVFNTLSMECFQCVNAAIDLAELVVAELDLGFPSKYREIFEFLHRGKIIDKSGLEAFTKLIFLRNLIAHEYYKIKEKELKEMAGLAVHIEKFVDKVKKLK